MHSRIYSLVIVALLLVIPVTTHSQSVATDTSATSTSAAATTSPTSLPDYRDSAVVESKVRTYFADVPKMIPIAQCESRFRQFDKAGTPLDGGSGGMIGIFQINKSVHKDFALTRGFDIDTVEGNLGYARYLYTKSGTDPWISSFPCWGSTTTNPEAIADVSPTSPTSSGLTANLSFGMIHPQVLTLQRLLNAGGFIIATNGPGSVGNETTKFGSLTRESIRKFQCAKNLVCTGDEASTGYGFVGPRTRMALLSAATTSSSPPVPVNTDVRASHNELIAHYTQLIAELTAKLAALQAQK